MFWSQGLKYQPPVAFPWYELAGNQHINHPFEPEWWMLANVFACALNQLVLEVDVYKEATILIKEMWLNGLLSN